MILIALFCVMNLYSMDLPTIDPSVDIISKMQAAQTNGNSALTWRNRNELRDLRRDVDLYFIQNRQRDDSYQVLSTLLESAQATNRDRTHKEESITVISKAKIAAGASVVVISALQLALLLKTWTTDTCLDGFTSTGSLLSIMASISSGSYLIYDGISNTDAQLVSAEAAKTELLLLQKYLEIRKKKKRRT